MLRSLKNSGNSPYHNKQFFNDLNMECSHIYIYIPAELPYHNKQFFSDLNTECRHFQAQGKVKARTGLEKLWK